ncbi:hypothetical protein SCHPADRAFT_197066 [Schizopora paradoxa]|uniref:Uncharacterized protein n=1 Tax=Schizopora paradoxa TaxID=27342 RepID=A0A0H2RZ24_9AGAM|nr:hypothetical protein SCHPADRAFT_197066 [Schizopora paradoxa]
MDALKYLPRRMVALEIMIIGGFSLFFGRCYTATYVFIPTIMPSLLSDRTWLRSIWSMFLSLRTVIRFGAVSPSHGEVEKALANMLTTTSSRIKCSDGRQTIGQERAQFLRPLLVSSWDPWTSWTGRFRRDLWKVHIVHVSVRRRPTFAVFHFAPSQSLWNMHLYGYSAFPHRFSLIIESSIIRA